MSRRADPKDQARLDEAMDRLWEQNFDREVERIMGLSEEELNQELRDRGEDPEEVAAQTRAIIEKALKDHRRDP